jgi:hypothetical protein
MHPGVISSGIGSLFRSKPEVPGTKSQNENGRVSQTSTSSPMSPAESVSSSVLSQVPDDPNYNPPFSNDIRTVQRKGFEKALYFINKHSDGLTKATKEYVTSHFEFGGCMADYPGLRKRYNGIRSLEDIDELAQQRDQQGRLLRRVRFVNYYSASTGRLKPSSAEVEAPATEMKDMDLKVNRRSEGWKSGSVTPSTPRLSVEEHREDGGVVQKTLGDIDPKPISDNEGNDRAPPTALSQQARESDTEVPEIHRLPSHDHSETPCDIQDNDENGDGLPAFPPPSQSPPELDLPKYNDPDHDKLLQKEHARLVKAHDRAKKDREKALRDRERLVWKREKAAKKEADKVAKAAAANQSVQERQKLKRSATLNPEVYDKQLARDAEERRTGASNEGDIQKIKKQRDRKFCTLPAKDRRTGLRDPTWIRVYMEGVDEVIAHTTLFIPEGETYERLVGDTAERIESWVKEDQGTRAALEAEKSG